MFDAKMDAIKPIVLLFLASVVAGSSPGASMAAQFFVDLDDSTSGMSSPRAEAVVKRVKRMAPELFEGTEELVRKAGFDVETHNVTTEDGYILTLHRLVGGKGAEGANASEGAGDPVLLVHGLFCTSDLWVLLGPEHALAYQLLDRGYDVWLANLRGNPFSRRHESLSPQDAEFWSFSWHEMGMFDLPAFIEYVLNETRRDALFYVGHSMGNTAFYVMASSRPEFNARVRLHVGLAPVAFIGRIRTPLADIVLSQERSISRALEASRRLEVFPASPARAAFLFLLCNVHSQSRGLCLTAIDFLYGPSHPGLNQSLVPFYMAHMTQGCSIRTIAHFAQTVVSGHFRPWESESVEDNMVRYGSSCPQDYALDRASAPSALFYAQDDYELHPDGVMRLSRELPNVVAMHSVSGRPFNHVDFLLSPHAKELVYDHVLKLFTQH